MIFDFKNPEALKALTTTLLQKDFGLQVEIPSNRLVPTLPLRLNYLLWMEDLIRFLNKPREEETRGADIGTNNQHLLLCSFPHSSLPFFFLLSYD